jgi:hypothetical protein
MKQTSKQTEAPRIIVGIDKIEKYLKRSYVDMARWKRDFSFPLEKQGSVCVLDLGKFEAWAAKWEFTKSTNDASLMAIWLRNTQAERLAKIPDRTLTGFQEMAEFAGRDGQGDILQWAKNWADWPGGRNEANQPIVNSRDYQKWLEAHGFRKSAHPAALKRVRDDANY